MKRILLLFAAFATVLTMSAASVRVGSIYYAINTETHTAEVTNVLATEENAVIPGTITYEEEDYTVTSIRSLGGRSSLVSVRIAETVVSIGEGAFNDLENLEEVWVDDPSAWCKIDFKGDNSNPFDYYWEAKLRITGSPETITLDNSVTKIPNFAFNNSDFKSIIIPESVTSIGESAFYGCNSLTLINIPESVTTIGGGAFCDCTSLISVILPNTLTSIEGVMFYGCSSLTTINIPNSVTTIGENAFRGCSSLTEITIPESVTSIGNSAFQDCSSLAEVIISDAVASIGENAFNGCRSLTNLTIGNSVATIGSNAFSGCNKLEELWIHDPSAWCNVVFVGSHPLQNANVKLRITGNPETITLDNSVSKIPEYCFRNADFKSIIIPESVTTIGAYAFYGNSSLSTVCIPESVISIDYATFANCKSLASVDIPNNLNSIGAFAFFGNSSLTAIDIPESVKSIGNNSFQDCSSLAEINFNATNCLTMGAEGNSVFKGCNSLATVNIGNNVTKIPNYAFYNCGSLKELKIGNSVTTIGESAFNGCSSLVTMNIPNSVTTIGKSAFNGCSSLVTMNIPNSVTSICDYAFGGCSSLETIEFPASVNNYGANLLSDTPTNVIINGVEPMKYVFGTNKMFFVPAEAVDAYRTAWPLYATSILAIGARTDFDVIVEARDNSSDVMDMVNNDANESDAMLNVVSLKVTGSINSYDIMTMRNKMKNLRYLDLSNATVVANSYEYYTGYSSEDDVLGTNAFRGLQKLRSIKLPKVKSLGDNVFYLCYNLKDVVFPDGLVTIGLDCFADCRSLKEVNLPNGLISIAPSCFRGCYELESLNCGKTLEIIGDGAFSGCSKLKTVKFSSVLTTIESSAFSGCSALTKIELPQTIKTIGEKSFNYCESLKEIMIPISVEEIGNQAFNNTSIMDIWTWTVKPTNINQNTFPSYMYTMATLHVPNFSKKYYYWDTQWSQFVNFIEFSGEYPFFKLSDDLELGKNDARIQGETDDDGIVKNPDADLASGSGIVVEGDESQNLGEVELKSDGTESASLIGDDSATDPSGANINIDCLKIKIEITQNKWYFFAFPFDIPFGSIHFNGQFVWRYYDGEYRSLHGSGAWKNVEGKLLAGRGYIFQASKGGTLTIEVGKVSLNGDDKMIALESHGCENAANASWNLIGNPFTSYYELSDVGIKAPITMWDGNKYQAYSPMDDELTMHPYQAFFVQKPNDAESVDFFANLRETKCQSENPDFRKNVSSRRKARANTSEIREIVNLEISDGTNGDRTRVVFNEAKNFGYELDCDASKFLTSGEVQLYTIDNVGTLYAINERPVGDGIVRLGFCAPAPGTYTISSPRMDREMEIVDLKTGEVRALADGYTFTAVAGTDNDRFMLREAGATNGVGNIAADGEGNSVYIGTNGVIYGSEAPANSVVIRRTGNTVEKLFNK